MTSKTRPEKFEDLSAHQQEGRLLFDVKEGDVLLHVPDVAARLLELVAAVGKDPRLGIIREYGTARISVRPNEKERTSAVENAQMAWDRMTEQIEEYEDGQTDGWPEYRLAAVRCAITDRGL